MLPAVLLHGLVQCSRGVTETRSRNAKIALLAECLRQLAPEERDAGVAFLSGKMRQGRIGLGYAAVMKGHPPEAAREPSLSLLEVDDTLSRIAAVSGAGSSKERLRLYGGLLARATAHEQEFLMRLLVGEVRQGALEGILYEAVARAAAVPPATVRRAAMLSGDLGAVARAALGEGEAGLARFDVQLFVPLRPMLAQTCDDPAEALGQLGEAALDFKLDGARVQVHKSGDDVRVFTRHLREVSFAVPEVVELASRLPARELILDGEVIALRPDGAPHPFQTTMRRFGRKLEVERLRAELPLSASFFDCLYADGESLIDLPTRERFLRLPELAGGAIVERVITADPERAEAFLDEALHRGHEGIMAKSLAAGYAAGNRGAEWLKIKPAHTLDLVVLAVDWGHGRRQGWLSNLHLGARDESHGGFVMLGKTFKGMTDEMLRWQTARFQELAIGKDEHTVYLRPELVVECAVSDIQESSRYPAGLALRLARVKRYRLDKPAAEADTIETVRRMHTGQHKKTASRNSP
jgi:DNA ligase-1